MTTTGSVERAEATAHGPHGVHAQVRGHTVTTDRPEDMGGQDRGLMASEHVLVALASCTATTAQKVAAKRSVRLDDVRVATEMRFDERGEVTDVSVTARVRSPDDENAVRKVFDLTARVCTISKLIAIPISHTVEVEK